MSLTRRRNLAPQIHAIADTLKVSDTPGKSVSTKASPKLLAQGITQGSHSSTSVHEAMRGPAPPPPGFSQSTSNTGTYLQAVS